VRGVGSPNRRRVAITGLGCATPLGVGAEATWAAAVEGRSGIRAITRFDATDYPVRFAGEVPGELDLSDVPPKEARRIDRVIALALVAAREALADASLAPDESSRDRIGVAIGSGIGGLETLQSGVRVLDRSGPKRVQPFMIPMAICNMSSGYVSIRFGLRGPNLCHVSACATGTHSIGEAARSIERGEADVMLAGGSEAPVLEMGVAGFAAMRALSTRNDAPAAASRPFDRARDGFVVGEGAGVLVLESLEHARARGARVRAELLGYGATADAVHVAQPTPDAEGAQRCMRLALADAGISPGDVDHINAHATSTPAGDPSEARAIRAVFGAHAERIAVSATKSMTGHLLGAAGAVEALLAIRALESGVLPPTINLDAVDEGCELDHVANKARQQRIRVALSNSFGFGGTNAAILLGLA
jgi:3-oxoacyl-[acyl-carrier-protein] synthase II